MMARGNQISAWLLEQGRMAEDMVALLRGLIRQMQAVGIPVARMTLGQRTLHPEIAAVGYSWNADEDEVQIRNVGHELHQTVDYLVSPVRVILDGGEQVRCRLEGDDPDLEYAFLERLMGEGFTDYIALPVPLTDGRRNPISFAIQRAGGFTDADIADIRSFLPVFGLLSEIHSSRQLASNLLDVYLGHGTGERVLEGAIRRGFARRIPAAVFFCDLRGFTAMSERLPRDFIIHVLNDYFEAVGGAIEAAGGEILKFIGDAALAIFPVGEADSTTGACNRALDAALAAIAALEKVNTRRNAEGKADLVSSFGLHVGDVFYGNIGASGRLDFTVIGPAVNRAARLEKLSADMAEPILVTSAFAEAADGDFRSVGHHPLKGIEAEVEAFAPIR
ncbi:MAG: adenylate/guanylate cyclase domain-containing protein [Minwuia sp.]|nr:adenylate/guanylate cyclase domain-containing protein [Minwuia sp.]